MRFRRPPERAGPPLAWKDSRDRRPTRHGHPASCRPAFVRADPERPAPRMKRWKLRRTGVLAQYSLAESVLRPVEPDRAPTCAPRRRLWRLLGTPPFRLGVRAASDRVLTAKSLCALRPPDL